MVPQEAQLKTFRNCLRQILGIYHGPDGPSTAELVATTGQTSMADLMRWHRTRWLGHAARKPNDVVIKQLLYTLHPGPPQAHGAPAPHVDGHRHA